jgi:uncharacterized protein YeaO (DUF488 family)
MRKSFVLLVSLAFLVSGTHLVASDRVTIQILEGSFKDKSWECPDAKVVDTFAEEAFAITAVPSRYSPRGHQLDRPSLYLIRGEQKVTLPEGEYRFLLRARGGSRLYVDDKLVGELAFFTKARDGHEPVPPLPKIESGLKYPLPGQRDKIISFRLDGREHAFRWETIIGGKDVRNDVCSPVVAISPKGKPFYLLGATLSHPYSESGWDTFAARSLAVHHKRDVEARNTAMVEETKYWTNRHYLARKIVKDKPPITPPNDVDGSIVYNSIDAFIAKELATRNLKAAALIDDDAFLRRVSLDTVGVIPTAAELAQFRQDTSNEKRSKAIDRLLSDPRWADHWTSYWQDVLAENPGILKPTLNNTGPFRWWIYRALLENTPMDRFVTDLTMMEGSTVLGEPSGFSIATENDVPMAAKGQILAKAFLAADLTCARCHDAPAKNFKQEQLFSLAAMLHRNGLKVPPTSSVKMGEGLRVPAVKVTLKPNTIVAPDWKFPELTGKELPDGVLRNKDDQREMVAALITSPTNDRFAKVLVNRVWKRYMGVGLIEPVDSWSKDVQPSHPELLEWLARELMTHNYDLKHVARLILSSHTYQRVVQESEEETPSFAAQHRRRMSAEQIIDSLFLAAGKKFDTEELTFDPEGRQSAKNFISLGVPTRAWHFVGLSNERDRPALALPVAQTFVDALMTYGWRDSRPTALTIRDESPNALSPMILANGLIHHRGARVSDDSAFTTIALEEQSIPDLVDRVYDRVLSRKPEATERNMFVDLLSEGYRERHTGNPAQAKPPRRTAVSWSNHLHPDATRLKLELETLARQGDASTRRLANDWRKRYEDMIWVLMNSPEFIFVP